MIFCSLVQTQAFNPIVRAEICYLFLWFDSLNQGSGVCTESLGPLAFKGCHSLAGTKCLLVQRALINISDMGWCSVCPEARSPGMKQSKLPSLEFKAACKKRGNSFIL